MNDEQKWQIVARRESAHDGKLFYGVMTTGVYCRPSCPSRLALRKNVRFYDTPTAAEKDGLRACLRCHPLDNTQRDRVMERIRAVCLYVDHHADKNWTLSTLARRAHISAFYFQRRFKEIIGISPRQYVEAARIRLLKKQLRTGSSVANATYEVGYGSGSRVYERVDTKLGMTPKQYGNGAAGVSISYATTSTPMGLMLLAATDRGLCFLEFGASKPKLLDRLTTEYPRASIAEMKGRKDNVFSAWMEALAQYMSGEQKKINLPLDNRGTAFQLKVWNYLQNIPYGQLQSYAQVAAGIGMPSAVRAVATACAKNHVALVIPCHRVIRGDGTLGGYKWGIDRKRQLLAVEGREAVG